MSTILKLFMVVFGVVAVVAGVGVPYFSSLISLDNKGEVKIRDQIIVVDIAGDDEARRRGLSGHPGLAVNEGMLFLFEDAGYWSFWMKDMRFPIDIVWIAGDRIVGFEERVAPEPGAAERDLRRYAPPEPVDKVLELAAGRVRLLRAEVGDTVRVRRLIAAGGS